MEQLVQLQGQYDDFHQAGTEIIAISNEDHQRAAKLKAENAITFPILADTDRTVIQQYGVFHQAEPKGRPIARPAAFIIDGNGVIEYRYVGEDQRDRPAAADLLKAASMINVS